MNYKSIKLFLIFIIFLAFVDFFVKCSPVRGNRTRTGKNKVQGKQLELPGNDVEPRTPEEEDPFIPNEPQEPNDPFLPKQPREPRNRGFISNVLSFVRDIIGGRKRWYDGGRPTDDGNDDRDDDDGSIWTSIRRNVANFLDGLVKTFSFRTPSTPDANFPYNKPERQKRL